MPEAFDLIVGSDPLLAVHLAARTLNTTDRGVCWIVEQTPSGGGFDYHLAPRLLQRLIPSLARSEHGEDRFRIFTPGEFRAAEGSIHCRDAWVLSGTLSSPTANAADHLDGDRRLIALAQSGRPTNLNYVGRSAALATAVLSHLKEVRAGEAGGRDVCFCVETLLYADPADGEVWDDDLTGIVGPLGEVIREVQERWSEYFDWSPLRLAVEPNHKVEFLRVDEAVRLMFKLSGAGAASGETYSLGSSLSMSAEELCACLGRVCQVDLRAAGVAAPLNAVDRLLAERLLESGSHLTLTPDEAAPVAATIRVEPEEPGGDAALLETLLRRAYQSRAALYDERERRVAALPQALQTRTVSVGTEELTYYRAGSEGDALILLSALGQGIDWWVRLIEPLMRRHRVYVWEPRGVTTPSPRPLGLEDHVADIRAVMEAEGLASCVLVGWCNGPQVAVEYYRKHPETVRGMVFLNCTFEVPGRPELDAPYEKYFRKLCEVITTRPEFAPSAMKSLGSIPEPKRSDLLALDGDKRASTVIRLPPRRLRSHLTRPFEAVETTRRYAAQVLDYFAHASLDHAPEVRTPVLVFSAEYDSVVSPERVQAIAACFPRNEYISISGATHYALYERSETVALKLERFLSGC